MAGSIDWIAPFLERDSGIAPGVALLRIPEWERTDWETLFAHASPAHVGSGSVLIQKDATERALYFVLTGMLEVTTVLSSHSLSLIRKVPPGSVVGELAFFDARPRSAKVWAVAESDLYRLDFDGYVRFAEDHPRLACSLLFGLGRVVATRMRHTMSAAGR